MRVFVSGSTGLLGRSLVPQLLGAGHEVIGAARGGDADIECDLTDPGQAGAALQQADPDAIINLTALTNVDCCEADQQLAYLVNIKVVENLAGFVRVDNSSCHFVQISTDQVYDGAGRKREDDITLSNCYGFSKYAGELAAMNVGATVLRTNFFGKSLTAERSSLTDWLMQAMRKGQDITVFEDVFFSPLAIGTLVEMIELTMRRQQPGIYNLGSHDGMSKADFAFGFAAVMGLSLDHVTRGSSAVANFKARRPCDMRMDSSKFETTFGVQLPELKSEIDSMRDVYGK